MRVTRLREADLVLWRAIRWVSSRRIERDFSGWPMRLLGSAEEAEDVVQDAFLRWAGADRSAIN